MTMRFRLLLALTWLIAPSAGADAPSVSDLDRAVEKGLFLVLEDEGVNLAIIGAAPEGMGEGALRRLDSGRGDLIVAAQTLRRDHPASLDTLPRRAVRVATSGGFCAARLGRVFVVDVASRATMNTHREAPMADRDEAHEVWSRGGYVAAVIERGCHGGILVSTHVTDSPTRAVSQVTSPDPQAELAFLGSDAAREASMFRTTSGQDGGGVIVTRTASLGEGHSLAFVAEVLPDVWHCSGAQTVFTTVVERRNGELRRVSAPRMDFEMGAGALVLDLNGDGALELLFAHEGDVYLFELRTDRDELVPLGSVGVSYEIGC